MMSEDIAIAEYLEQIRSKNISSLQGVQLDDGSDCDDLKLVIACTETPSNPNQLERRKKSIIPAVDQKLIDDHEELFEATLNEKAAKSKQKDTQVKSIHRHVFTNEDVLEFVKNAEYSTEVFSISYEPKITRSKAKELAVKLPFKWTHKELSETHVLINEELPEDDSSGDEYVPVDAEDSEDDHNSSITASSLRSPINLTDCATQTNWTEDGAFQILSKKNQPVSKPQTTEEANIARRTRSKLCLSNTPLEVIESTFIPPDITRDMYEMDYECDEDWKAFLKGFSRPLDDVGAIHEDEEEHEDPEYNVLADKEVVDTEELKTGKSVSISRKELNDLIGELMDYADNYDTYNTLMEGPTEHVEETVNMAESKTANSEQADGISTEVVAPMNVVILDYKIKIMTDEQKGLFEQQMRQHIQLLTQGFMIAYDHPLLNSHSSEYKQYLAELKNAMLGSSFYDNSNIEGAVETANNWEQMLQSDIPSTKEYKEHVIATIDEARDYKEAKLVYIPKFPKLLLETISKSNVFVYPSFLPTVPCTEINPKIRCFSAPENELIALGLEQFVPYLNTSQEQLNELSEVKLKDICLHIKRYVMPSKDVNKLYRHVCGYKNHKPSNPIRRYFETNMVPPTMHVVIPIKEYLNIPPCNRNPNELPHQWREFIHPGSSKVVVTKDAVSVQSITKVNKPPVYNKKFAKRRPSQINLKQLKSPKIAKSLPKNSLTESLFKNGEICASTPKCKKSLFKFSTPGVKKTIQIPESLLRIKFNSSIFNKSQELNQDTLEMSMPNIDASGIEINVSNILNESESGSKDMQTNLEELIVMMPSTSDHTANDVIDENFREKPKDNLDDINELLVASSTIKSATKRRPTGLEKKRAKMKRNFTDNLRLLAEEDSDIVKEKRDRFIQAFYDKVQEMLSMEDFNKFVTLLNDFEENHTTPKELYNQVAQIIGDKHPDIMNEFLLFFDSYQVKQFGKLIPYLLMSNMSFFLRKLEIFFQDQPFQVRKIFRALNDMAAREDVTMAQVKSTILPLLKGNTLLCDWFLQTFPMEKPPSSLLNGAWEYVCFNKDTDDNFENLVLPEVDDPSGAPNCSCTCHNGEKTKPQHCTRCGARFMQGRVFLQTGKGLRPAKITFDDTCTDHRARLSASIKKRCDLSPTKQISPGKESQDETRPSSDDEPEKKRLSKVTKKRKPRKKSTESNMSSEKQSPVVDNKMVVDDSPILEMRGLEDEDEEEINLQPMPPCIDITPKLMADEPQEWDCNTSIDSVEIRQSPEPCPSPESESECCEEFETSQDNASDSDISGNDGEATTQPSTMEVLLDASNRPWTREEDKVILETFQAEEVIDTAFQLILEKLTSRTLEQVKERFDVLINFLKKMRNNC